MPVRTQHEQLPNSIYFVTFTFYKWMPLFQKTNSYDTVYKWFDHLYEKDARINGYVIMPNHLHALLYFSIMPKSLNTVIGNAKRFIAYEVIKRLEAANENELLDILHAGVSKQERKKARFIKCLRIVLTRKNVIQKNLFTRSWIIFIITLCVENGNW